MRITLTIALVFILSISCINVEYPRPIIQGEVDAVLFRTNSQNAFIENGVLNIVGSTVDQISLQVSGTSVGVYTISPSSVNSASFVRDGQTYITSGSETGGVIEIEEITSSYVTGNFFFEARRDGSGNRLNFSKGVFYQIPFSSSEIDVPGEED